jgi:uncharacterized membrane protein YeaQ/YmgE (transglycosylase-associated protein family)
MTIVGFLLLLLLGALCGAVAELIVGFSPGGFLASAVVGFLGAVIGGWIAPRIGLPSVLAVRIEGYTIEVVWSVLGAIVLLAVLAFIRRATYPRARTY